MPTGYYEDDEGGGMPGPPSGTESEDTSQEEDSRDERTALLPTSLCPGMEVGDEITLRIEAVHEGEYEVSYNESGGEGKKTRYRSGQPSMEKAMKSNRMESFLED